MDLRTYKTETDRRKALEKELGITFKAIVSEKREKKEDVHCENKIGIIGIPLGIAGPILLNTSRGSSVSYIPLATTEGALVASVNRGCKLICESGGAYIVSEYVGATRGLIFEVESLKSGQELRRGFDIKIEELKKAARRTSSHLSLNGIVSSQQGKYIYVRFIFDTDEAMGMNMSTIASTEIAKYIQDNFPCKLLAVAGNFDVDKKPSWLNFLLGRGRKLHAEVIISEKLVNKILHVTPTDIAKTTIHKCWGGSIMSGSMGFNAHFANVVAAFYAATGQDLAHVVEGSLGVTYAEVLNNGDLYFSVYLPDILVGVVGGGTKLKAQTEARKITNTKTSQELSEVLAGAVLAGEISLIGSIAEGSLGEAHRKLGRYTNRSSFCKK